MADDFVEEFLTNILTGNYGNYEVSSQERTKIANDTLKTFVDELDRTDSVPELQNLQKHLLNPYYPENTNVNTIMADEISQKSENMFFYNNAYNKANAMLDGFILDENGNKRQTDLSRAYHTIMNGNVEDIVKATKYWDFNTVMNLSETIKEINRGLQIGKDEDLIRPMHQNSGVLQNFEEFTAQVDALFYDAAYYKSYEHTSKDNLGNEMTKILPLLTREEIPYIINGDIEGMKRLRNDKLKLSENSYYSNLKKISRRDEEFFRLSKDLGKQLVATDGKFEVMDVNQILSNYNTELSVDSTGVISNENKQVLTQALIGNTLLRNNQSEDGDDDIGSFDIEELTKLSEAIQTGNLENISKQYMLYAKSLQNSKERLQKENINWDIIHKKYNGQGLLPSADQGHWTIVEDSSKNIQEGKGDVNIESTGNNMKVNMADVMGIPNYQDTVTDSIKTYSADRFVNSNYTDSTFHSDVSPQSVAIPTKDSRFINSLGVIRNNIGNLNLNNPVFNQDVKNLQKFLSEQKLLNANQDVDGLYGKRTHNALNRFLISNNMEPITVGAGEEPNITPKEESSWISESLDAIFDNPEILSEVIDSADTKERVILEGFLNNILNDTSKDSTHFLNILEDTKPIK